MGRISPPGYCPAVLLGCIAHDRMGGEAVPTTPVRIKGFFATSIRLNLAQTHTVSVSRSLGLEIPAPLADVHILNLDSTPTSRMRASSTFATTLLLLLVASGRVTVRAAPMPVGDRYALTDAPPHAY